MEPKFQSSFIPKGPVASSVPTGNMSAPRRRDTDLFSVAAGIIFVISLVLAGAAFTYKLYLNYRLAHMKEELTRAREELQPETVNSILRLNSRLVSTETLVKNHIVISPVFDFLESATPKTVRYTDFGFTTGTKGTELTLQGQAKSYAALAGAAEVFNKAGNYFADTVFSDLKLDEKGNVVFTVKTKVKPSLLSYERAITDIGHPVLPITTSSSTAPAQTTSSSTPAKTASSTTSVKTTSPATAPKATAPTTPSPAGAPMVAPR